MKKQISTLIFFASLFATSMIFESVASAGDTAPLPSGNCGGVLDVRVGSRCLSGTELADHRRAQSVQLASSDAADASNDLDLPASAGNLSGGGGNDVPVPPVDVSTTDGFKPPDAPADPDAQTAFWGREARTPVVDSTAEKNPRADDCESSQKTAYYACNTLGTQGMDGSTGMMADMLLNQIINIGVQMKVAGENASRQCKIQADVAKWMGSLNAIKGATCAKTMSSCQETCGKAAEYEDKQEKANSNNSSIASKHAANEREYRKQVNICKSYTMNFIGMMTQSVQNLGNYAVNSQCAKELAATSTPPPPSYTPPNLTLPTTGDCSDPNNQSLGCYCQKAENKNAAFCKGGTANPIGGGNTVGTTAAPGGAGTGANPYGVDLGDPAGTSDFDPSGLAAKQNASGGGAGMSDGGGSAPGGGLSSLGSSGGDGGGGGAGDPRSAITGVSGGQGGGLGGGGGGSGGGGGLARNNGKGGAGDGSGGGFFDKFNLKKFLPGSKYKSRGIAGMSVKSVDGITGPMGPSIWEKATKQYQEQIQKQNVLLDK